MEGRREFAAAVPVGGDPQRLVVERCLRVPVVEQGLRRRRQPRRGVEAGPARAQRAEQLVEQAGVAHPRQRGVEHRPLFLAEGRRQRGRQAGGQVGRPRLLARQPVGVGGTVGALLQHRQATAGRLDRHRPDQLAFEPADEVGQPRIGHRPAQQPLPGMALAERAEPAVGGTAADAIERRGRDHPVAVAVGPPGQLGAAAVGAVVRRGQLEQQPGARFQLRVEPGQPLGPVGRAAGQRQAFAGGDRRRGGGIGVRIGVAERPALAGPLDRQDRELAGQRRPPAVEQGQQVGEAVGRRRPFGQHRPFGRQGCVCAHQEFPVAAADATNWSRSRPNSITSTKRPFL
ncbi:hypothetical protein [Chitinimonas koreensis]|uniref:hypothetical protein n=1 Tax=Chitinimonas koreensis TaxID=356302 RepID=UPI001654AABB|nr:hypothetical protein [Chitinimonas koreensis]QNM98502.1 hypothetical protein H9L41_09870 [Chitinimonas koreensis]